MRLRYLHIRNYPPLEDLEIVFSAKSPLNTTNAIHFVVGVNGSGKTHLLQALTEAFLCMERKQTPAFPVTLIYELGKDKKHTYIFDHAHTETKTVWWQSADNFYLPPEANTEHFQNTLKHVRNSQNSGWSALIRDGNWPGTGERVGLPVSVLTYTTGNAEGWYELFQERQRASNINFDAELEERPVGWSLEQEDKAFPDKEIDLNVQTSSLNQVDEIKFCQFVTPFMLKLAVLAVTLNLALDELKQHRTDDQRKAFINSIKAKQESTGLRGLLSQVGWVWPVSMVIECEPTPAMSDSENRSSAAQFWRKYQEAAITVLGEPEPSKKRRVVFDLGNTQKEESLRELFDLSETPFSIFEQLLNMQQDGVLDNLIIGLRKADTEDILLFDELSDGEQMYLGRMALFHLLEKQDDVLLIMDEPENHFNDFWKREMVAIIDNAMKERTNHMLISTHSSITLTDVFDDEIIRFKKEGGHVRVVPLTSTTFGADPSEIMINVFEAEDSIGERSLEWLNAQLEKDWGPEHKQELEHIIKKIGPGLHRSELRTIWRKLNAA